jgi:hypothetical protein
MIFFVIHPNPIGRSPDARYSISVASNQANDATR